MKITSWNVNGIRAVEKKGLHAFFAQDNADVYCIQETKAHPDQLAESLIAPPGYQSYWSSAVKKGYSGTAIYSKHPLEVQEIGNRKFDDEGRVLITELSVASARVILINAYFPNSQDAGKRLDYKLEFCNFLLSYCNAVSDPLILCGDFNIAHKEIDLARPKANENSPGFLPEERAWMTEFIESGYVDTFRTFNQEPHQYTWWSYRGGSRERNVGWRIDYFTTNKKAQSFVKECSIQHEIMGSDHCPLSIMLQ